MKDFIVDHFTGLTYIVVLLGIAGDIAIYRKLSKMIDG